MTSTGYTSACGFDFGTSNSALGVSKGTSVGSDVKLVEFPDGKLTTPTAIFFDDDERRSFTGEDAKERYMAGDNGRYLRALKSILGTSLMDEKTVVMGHKVPFNFIVSNFITRVKEQAEQQMDHSFENVVVGRPVFFFEDDEAKNVKAESALKACF